MASCGVLVLVLRIAIGDATPPAAVAPGAPNALQATVRLRRAVAEDQFVHGDIVDVGAADRDPGLVRDVQNGAVVGAVGAVCQHERRRRRVSARGAPRGQRHPSRCRVRRRPRVLEGGGLIGERDDRVTEYDGLGGRFSRPLA